MTACVSGNWVARRILSAWRVYYGNYPVKYDPRLDKQRDDSGRLAVGGILTDTRVKERAQIKCFSASATRSETSEH